VCFVCVLCGVRGALRLFFPRPAVTGEEVVLPTSAQIQISIWLLRINVISVSHLFCIRHKNSYQCVSRSIYVTYHRRNNSVLRRTRILSS